MLPDEAITPELVIEEGKAWANRLLATLPPEQRIEGLSPEERLEGLQPKERLEGLDVKEIEKYLESLKNKN